MTQEQKATLAKMFAVRAELSGSSFSQAAIIQMVEDTSDLDFLRVVDELQKWGKTETTFPHPAKLRAKVMPEMNQDDNAVMVANLIMKSISMDGYTNPDRAKQRMGSLAWEVVNKFGGWQTLCETTNSDNMGTVRAQLRGLALTTHKQALRGEINEVPSLPSPQNEVAAIIKTTVHQIGEMK